MREHWGRIWIGSGIIALGVYGFVATLQPDGEFGRILAAYGGLLRRIDRLGHGRRQLPPDRWDVTGALIWLAGMGVIMYAPRGH